MSRQSIPVLYDFYDVQSTPCFDQLVENDFVYLAEKYGETYADCWLDAVEDLVVSLERPLSLGVIDSLLYSGRYTYCHVPKTHTTIFFLVEENRIFLVAVGWSSRDWPTVLADLGPEIETQIDALRARGSS